LTLQPNPETHFVKAHTSGCFKVLLLTVPVTVPATTITSCTARRHHRRRHRHHINGQVSLVRCGQVKTASEMPAAIFEPDNRVALSADIADTKQFYEYGSGDGASCTTLGTCASRGFLERGPLSEAALAAPNPGGDEFGVQTKVRMRVRRASAQHLPAMQTELSSSTNFCSLCTTAGNVPRPVQFYYARDLDASN
jgi:hypothetical protein